MRRVIAGTLGVLVVGWLARRWVGIEIVRESELRARTHTVTAPPVTFPGWYREWITAQACVRSRYDC